MSLAPNPNPDQPALAEIPRRDLGLVALPVLGLVALVLVLVRPALLALPLAAASLLAALGTCSCMEARSIQINRFLVGAATVLLVVVAVARPALYLPAVTVSLFAVAIWAMSRLPAPGTSDSLFSAFSVLALLAVPASHLGLVAVSPFAGGESMGKALAVVTMLTAVAALSASAVAEHSLRARSTGGALVGGRLGADLAGLLAAVLVALVASTLKKPSGSTAAYLGFAVVLSGAVALGKRLVAALVTGEPDPEEIVTPSRIGEAYSVRIMLPLSMAFMAAYFVGRLVFV